MWPVGRESWRAMVVEDSKLPLRQRCRSRLLDCLNIKPSVMSRNKCKVFKDSPQSHTIKPVDTVLKSSPVFGSETSSPPAGLADCQHEHQSDSICPGEVYSVSRAGQQVCENPALIAFRCDVADALIKLKVPHGGFLAGLTMWSPTRQEGPTKIIGPAYTVKYVRKHYENEPKPSGHYVRYPHLPSTWASC